MSILLNGTEIKAVNFKGTDIQKVIYNGTKVFVKEKYLFKSGTGKVVSWANSVSSPASSDITTERIHTLSDGNTGQCLVYSALVDVTDYDYLNVDVYQSLRMAGYYGHSDIGLAQNTSFDSSMSYLLKTFTNNVSRQVFKLNISSVTGSYRVKFWSKHDNGAYGTHTYLYNIWLS